MPQDSCLRRVVTACMQRMTAGDAADPAPSPPQKAVLVDRLNHVMTARWFITADTSQPRADQKLVQPHHGHEQPSRQSYDGLPQKSHMLASSSETGGVQPGKLSASDSYYRAPGSGAANGTRVHGDRLRSFFAEYPLGLSCGRDDSILSKLGRGSRRKPLERIPQRSQGRFGSRTRDGDDVEALGKFGSRKSKRFSQ